MNYCVNVNFNVNVSVQNIKEDVYEQNPKKYGMVDILTLLVSFAVFTGGEGETDDGKILVGFSQIDAERAWRIANTISIKEEAADRDNIELIFTDAQQKQENQIRSLRSFIDQGVDVTAFSPSVESGYGPVLQEAIVICKSYKLKSKSCCSLHKQTDLSLRSKNRGKK